MFRPAGLSLPHLYVVWVAIILGTWWFSIGGLGLVDVWLAATGRVTVSESVWARPWLGVPIVLWFLAGPAFLAAHFWLGLLRP